jgi:hypothetical protein
MENKKGTKKQINRDEGTERKMNKNRKILTKTQGERNK